MNVKHSDGTLILFEESLDKGTQQAYNYAVEHHKPLLIANINDEKSFVQILNWINMYCIRDINIAGPRESNQPGIYEKTKRFLDQLFVF